MSDNGLRVSVTNTLHFELGLPSLSSSVSDSNLGATGLRLPDHTLRVTCDFYFYNTTKPDPTGVACSDWISSHWVSCSQGDLFSFSPYGWTVGQLMKLHVCFVHPNKDEILMAQNT